MEIKVQYQTKKIEILFDFYLKYFSNMHYIVIINSIFVLSTYFSFSSFLFSIPISIQKFYFYDYLIFKNS